PTPPARRAPHPPPRPPTPPRLCGIAASVESYFQDQATRRLYIQIDKPMYQPGETIWIKTWDLLVRDQHGGPSPAITYELVNPKGATVQRKRVQQQDGQASNDFVIAADAEGGEYRLRAQTDDGKSETRTVVVRRYEAPR